MAERLNMAERFHERFDIALGQQEVRVRFINRVHNEIFETFLRSWFNSDQRFEIVRQVASALGDRHHSQPLAVLVGEDFYRNLEAIESLRAIFAGGPYERHIDPLVQMVMERCELDLGIRWQSGQFVPTGARSLDETLVNDVLQWLREKGFESVLAAYQSGLRHLVAAEKEPTRAWDVVTDMHEALEGVAKRVTGRNANLSANAELFISKVKASEGYKGILKEYLAYANDGIRHAAGEGKAKPMVSVREAESFVYLTGVFIRLAMAS